MFDRAAAKGQVLVMFVLFLLVLLGVSALAIDYASWLLTDRNLQNAADHAALAGASEFQDRTTVTNCAGTKCQDARAQAWTSLNNELKLGLDAAAIGFLSTANSLAAGTKNFTVGSTAYSFADPIWVATPPPSYAAYANVGGRYAQNQGVVFVRVERSVRSFLGGAIGIQPQRRTGWATAGAIPTDFALELFCRNHIAPQSGVCENSAGLTIDGQGGVTLLKGDVGSNESLTVTANNSSGVVLNDGNVFLVNRTCANSTWRCPNGPPSLGGISDGTNGKNAFYIAPLPVPQYESPLDYATLSVCPDTATWNANHVPCVPYRNQYGSAPTSSGTWIGDWTCGDGTTSCGTYDAAQNRCTAGTLDKFMRPNTDDANPNGQDKWHGNLQDGNGNRWMNMDDSTVDPPGTLPATSPGSAVLAGSPTDWVSSPDGRTGIYRVGLTPAVGIPSGGTISVRYVIFRTANFGLDAAAGTDVNVKVSLKEKNGAAYNVRGGMQSQNATVTKTVYQYDVNVSEMTGATWYQNLYLEFEVQTAVAGKGVGVSWAEVEVLNLLPPEPPTIKAGYWHSITIPANGCAVLDPAPATGLMQYQLPGIFRFGGQGTGANAPRIVLGSNAYLIGDAVTVVLDPRSGSTGFPDNGIDVGTGGALLINTGTTTSNPSYPLTALPSNAANAAWQVDAADTTNPRDGSNMWPVCTVGGNTCVPRACYMNTDPNPSSACQGQTVSIAAKGRGISLYLTPNTWAHSSANIQRRFYMGGNGAADSPGIAFKGVLYAPYDDVKLTGRNNFNTVGQVLAWTAKFNGGNAGLFLDYPYDYTDVAPYLLEPTVNH